MCEEARDINPEGASRRYFAIAVLKCFYFCMLSIKTSLSLGRGRGLLPGVVKPGNSQRLCEPEEVSSAQCWASCPAPIKAGRTSRVRGTPVSRSSLVNVIARHYMTKGGWVSWHRGSSEVQLPTFSYLKPSCVYFLHFINIFCHLQT